MLNFLICLLAYPNVRTEPQSDIGHNFLLASFFSSGMADHALRLGPYMRRSC